MDSARAAAAPAHEDQHADDVAFERKLARILL